MKNLCKKSVVISFLVFSQGEIKAGELVGDHTVVADALNSEPGNLTVEGDSLINGAISFGYLSLAEEYGALLNYFDATKSITFDSPEAGVSFLWRQNADPLTADLKMELDENNLLSLFRVDGSSAGIILNPNTGALTLAGTDSGIYNSVGSPVFKIGSGGNAVFSSQALFEQGIDFGAGGILNPSKVGYLQGLLTNFGYQESAVESTAVSSIPLGSTISSAQLSVSSDGNLFVGGNFTFSSFVGSKSLVAYGTPSSLPFGGYLAKSSATGQVQWAKSFYTLSGSFSINSVLADGGGVIITGAYSGTTIGFGPGRELSGGGGFVAKLNSSGTVLWSKGIGVSPVAATVDGSGNVIVAGNFWGTITLLGTESISSVGGQDAIAIGLNSSGEIQWRKTIGGTGSDTSTSIVVDSLGNVIVAGNFSGTTTNLGTGYNLTSAGGTDAFLVNINSIGQVQWSKALGGISNDSLKALVINSSGNLTVAGDFYGMSNIIGLNSSRIVDWSLKIGSSVTSIKIDLSDNLTVFGSFSGTTTNLGTQNMTSSGGLDLYVARLSSAGILTHAERIGGTGGESGLDLALIGTKTFVSGNGAFAVGNIRTTNPFLISWEGSDITTPAPNGLLPASLSWNGGDASGTGSLAVGNGAVASGQNSTALGSSSLASGVSAFSTGAGKATGNNSAAFGSSTSLGQSSIAFGTASVAGGSNSAAFGSSTSAGGTNSTTFGSFTRTNVSNGFVIGYNNVGLEEISPTGASPLFEIGNGWWASVSSNALTTLKNGKTTLDNYGWQESSPLAVPVDTSTHAFSGGEALVVDGHTRLRGKVVIERPQGDISMGIYGAP